jgi:formylglycine-generating enzyme required for sulfatase activity
MVMMGKILKWVISVVSVIILTSLSIDAADHMDNFSESLLGSAVGALLPASAPCSDGMQLIAGPEYDLCVDIYEASVGEGCLFEDPQNQDESRQNIDAPDCVTASMEGAVPWRWISQNQAALACAKSGKRLPTNEEWYTAAMGTPDGRNPGLTACNVDGNWRNATPGETGEGAECVSAYGMYDMIGNVWEWVSETTEQGAYAGRTLPEPGFVSGVDQSGMPIETQPVRDDNYYNDRFWNDPAAVTGIFRGGYWDSDSDGGLYAVHAQVPPSFVGTGVGFRCVQNAGVR